MKRGRKRDIDLKRLSAAMYKARLSLKRYREERTEMVRQYVGGHWSEEGADRIVPLNMISLYVQIVGRGLIPKNPRVMLSTFRRQDRPTVSAMEQWCNDEIERMHLDRTMQRVVLDALFSVGICKVALSTPADAQASAWNLQAGKPFCERVDLDDFVFDVHARDFGAVSFIGHRYRRPLDAIRDSSLYSKARKDLAPSVDQPYNAEGDERINLLGRSYYTANDDEYKDHVDLWEIYLPQERRVVTLADSWLAGAEPDMENGPLRDQEWLGPDSGPYHILGYQWVPGNAMPKGPIQDLYDLHLEVNKMYRKLLRQADRQKEVLFVQGAASEDGSRLLETSDGEAQKCDNPDKINQKVWGGPNQANFLFAQHCWEQFSKHAGNLEMMGGLSPQSKTATQDKMLMQNASGQVTSMGDDTIGFVSEVCESLLWYWHHNPFKVMRTTHSLPGLPEMSVERRVTPQQRLGLKFRDMAVRVDPYSLQHQTPQSKVQQIMTVLQQIAPFMQLAQQQGVALDVNVLLDKLSKFLDLPELSEILNYQEPPEQQGEAQQQGRPVETTRNYVRRSLGGEGEQSQTAELANTLAKGANQTNGEVLSPSGASQ